ncbi:glycosyltransferase family 4 protein [Pseudanabaena yagii]|uniref:Glycosyltransferase family 4 protein n=1 Tax=Pseudanabaena yagii GIHE-NHR1 TaxID=2722753 RepID=A0ABX1LWI6_9CYAN|nr:glycosyltransferase family 4 protein [Pseudanabaena yagii]NMF60529.1 glycosyltransferase family 4 protein [Pseudanabaena yagii GIHE-NHR1]
MKPKILSVLIDRNVGGVTASVNSLLESSLAQKFSFALISPQEALSKHTKSKFRPDLTIVHDASSWKFLLTLLRLRMRSKLVIQEHHYSECFESLNVSQKWRFRLMLKIAYAIANRVIAVSYGQMKWMLKHKLVKPRNLTVIQQCRNLEDFVVLPSKPLGDKLILGVYGRFSAQKGIDLLLRAIQELPSLDLELLVGGYGEHEQNLRKMADGDHRIQFVGKLANVPQFLGTCDVVVIPSRWEPWGNVCLEAKAAGKPVIVTRVDGLTEQVKDCGLVVEANVEEIKEAIAKVVHIHQTSPQTLICWGEQGRQSVRGAWERYLAEWEALFWLSSK